MEAMPSDQQHVQMKDGGRQPRADNNGDGMRVWWACTCQLAHSLQLMLSAAGEPGTEAIANLSKLLAPAGDP